ncbi:MAG: RAMP superfamily CRISPR-associated protein [Nitrososphaerota archaeon]
MIRLEVELKTLSLFLVGGVAPVFTYSDINFYKTKDPTKGTYKPVIPGSSVKGALRSSLSRVAYAFQMSICSDRPSSYDSCDACYLFGAPGTSGHTYVSDFVGEFQTLLLTHVSLDDNSGTARRYALYTAEYVHPNTLFKGNIDYDGEVKRLPPLLIALAVLRTDRIGRKGTVDLRIINVGDLKEKLSAELGEFSVILDYLGRWAWDEDV